MTMFKDCAWADILEGVNAGRHYELSSLVLFLSVYQCLNSDGAITFQLF